MKTPMPFFCILAGIFALGACAKEDHNSRRVSSALANTDNAVATSGDSPTTTDQKLPDDAAHAANSDTPATPADGTSGTDGTSLVDRPAVGIRNFRQINDTMAALTGVPRTTAAVAAAFATLTTQLPDSNDIQTFSGSHQVAISKLAVEYCDAMIESPTLSVAAVPGFNFAATPKVAFDTAGKALVAKALVERFWGAGLESNPDEAATFSTLASLIDDTVTGKANTAQITKNIVKGVCTALLSTGPVLFL